MRTIENAFPELTVSAAGSASEALQVLFHHRIHVVFLDIMMPGMNGLELLAEARHPNIKWIVVSAHSEFAYAQEALRLGARDYILKPFGKEQIYQSVSILKEEWGKEERQSPDSGLLELNLKYLREGVFRRWVQGLDIGRFDLTSIKEEHDRFHLFAVKLGSSRELTLKNFVVENVMTEFLSMRGKGFIISVDGDYLVGVVTLKDYETSECFRSGAAHYLDNALKVPYRFHMSPLLTDFYAIPHELRKLDADGIDSVAEPSPENKHDVIDIALQYIRSNFKENLSLEIVASVVFLNPVYFSKLFKQRTGNGYKEYVTQLRMERAEELLGDHQLTITKIGELVGYPDVRHFTQVFRKKYDCTPSQFRMSTRGSS